MSRRARAVASTPVTTTSTPVESTSQPSSQTTASTNVSTSSSATQSTSESSGGDVEYTFKNKNWKDDSRTGVPKVGTGRGGGWRALKQILASENAFLLFKDNPTYSSIQADPSSKPTRKYCDLTGLPAQYRDPKSRMLYADARQHGTIKELPQHVQNAYLEIRNANVIIR